MVIDFSGVIKIPSHSTHRAIDRALFGKEFQWIHDLMDKSGAHLGPQHRKIGHDQETVIAIFALSGGDLKALISAEAHLLADTEVSRSKKLLRELFSGKKRYKRKRR